MKEVNIYLVSGIQSMQKGSGYVAYCLEYYPEGKLHPQTLIDVEEVEDMTGRCAELEVLIKTLKRLKEKCILNIYTESAYLEMGIGERNLIEKWHKNGWKDGKNVDIKNKDKWQEILKRLNGNMYRVYLNYPNAYVKMLHDKIKRKEGQKNV